MDPVDAEEVPEYYDNVLFPIDLGTMSSRLKNGYYVHERLFIADMKRMFANCYKFNGPDTTYYKHGYDLNVAFNKLAEQYFPDSSLKADLPDSE